MGLVYYHSSLNIAATGFLNGENGLFVKRDPNIMTPIAVTIEAGQTMPSNDDAEIKEQKEKSKEREYYLVDTASWKDGVDDSPLCKRGWVTQERAMSVRTIHFGKQQLFWECMSRNASEVFPNGFLIGTEIKNPKIFLTSESKGKRLESIREQVLKEKKSEEDFLASLRTLDPNFGLVARGSSGEGESCEEVSDKDFAKRMKALRMNNQLPTEESLESNDLDPESNLEYDGLSKEWKPFRYSVNGLQLSPRDFDGSDLNILDGLDIRGWNKFKAKLESWGFGSQLNRVKPLQVRGTSLELRKWVTIVEIYSHCSLSYPKDKLVAISGIAQLLGQKLNCDYLAGMWRRDLEHQILWKVTRSLPAPKKDGTRGPSWSWASVDGGVEIPEWSGYFYR
jgi:hypothetical protein